MNNCSRRGLLAGGAMVIASCGHRKAEGFPGYAFVANAAGKAVAVVDLGVFATTSHIRLEADPTEMAAFGDLESILVLTPSSGALHEIDFETLSLARSVRVSAGAAKLRVGPGHLLWLLAGGSGRLIAVSAESFSQVREVRLPFPVTDWDLSPDGQTAAAASGASGRVALTGTGGDRRSRIVATGGSTDIVRFRSDGRQVIVGDQTRRALILIDVAKAELVVELPLAVCPEHFCFKPDGGQLFITGRGLDAVVTVQPYQTQIGSTTLAGRAPGPMAASSNPDYLFITSPSAGDVTILNIDTQRVLAVTPVGAYPHHITVTPDHRYALVLNRDSGDMGVIRIATVEGRRRRSAPLFMMVPVGSKPVTAVVRAV